MELSWISWLSAGWTFTGRAAVRALPPFGSPYPQPRTQSHSPAAALIAFLAVTGKLKELWLWSINSAPGALLRSRHAEMHVGRLWSSSGVLGMSTQQAGGLGAGSLAVLLLNYALVSFLGCLMQLHHGQGRQVSSNTVGACSWCHKSEHLLHRLVKE